MSMTLPPANWTAAHAIEAFGVVALFGAFDALMHRGLEPGFYVFLFALWFTLSLIRYYLYVHRRRADRQRAANESVGAQLWRTSDTFVWVVFILLAFALYETVARRRYTDVAA